MEIMTAAVTAPGRIEHLRLETPELSGREVLVKVHAVALCTLEQRIFKGEVKMPYPCCGGHEVSGEIAGLGPDVNTKLWKTGDRVAVRLLYSCGECHECRSGRTNMCEKSQRKPVRKGLLPGPGGCCNYVIVNSDALFGIPNDLSYEQAALTEPLSCVVHSINRAGIQLADEVVVIGGGIMGQLHVILAKMRGARVISSETDATRRELALKNGADLAFDPSQCNIVEKIRELKKEGYNPGDIVILYRAHYISRVIEEVFQNKKIPYTLYSGLPFFDRMEIKDSLSYLRMIAYKDDLSFLRVVNTPKRNVGERRIKFLKEYAQENKTSLYEALKLNAEDSLFANTKAKDFIALIEKYNSTYSGMQISEIFSFIMNESGYEKTLRIEGGQERLDNLAELKQSIYEYETSCGEECTLENYLAHAALYTNTDLGSTKNAVRLMTIHSAKGLEFPAVILCGMNENMFPSKKIDSQAAMEEERRLAFVAVTRAQKVLYLTEAEGNTQGFGFRFPSRFIFNIDKRHLEYLVEHDSEYGDVSGNVSGKWYVKSGYIYLEFVGVTRAFEIKDKNTLIPETDNWGDSFKRIK